MNTGFAVSCIEQYDGGIVFGVSDGSPNGLVHCFHALVVTVHLACCATVRAFRLHVCMCVCVRVCVCVCDVHAVSVAYSAALWCIHTIVELR